MSNFIIRPWPFKNNEVAELYWLCSPYMNENREWILKAVFKYNNTVKVVELPWGTLPYLRLGRYYKNGTLFNTYQRGSSGEVKIDKEHFEICTSFEMPTKLYYFYKNAEFGVQKVCKFTIGEVTYFIPCIEIARSFFAKAKTLANYILKPNGLDFLVAESKIENKCLFISMSIEVPERIATRETAAILGWIKYNEEAYKQWCAVYSNIFAVEKSRNRLIELLPPVREDCSWNYRGIRSDNNVLILELSEATNIRTSFEYIKYSHPKIQRNRVTETPDKIRNSREGKDKSYEMVEDKNGIGTRAEQKQPVIEVAPTRFLFEDIKVIEKMTDAEREVVIGAKIISTGAGNLENGKATVKVSTGDWSGEGNIAPIEFKSLEIVRGQKGKGLEEFYKVVHYIKDNYKQYDISMTEVFLPEGKSFSYYTDGSRRNCAITKISCELSKECYILEVGRIDKWSISTLLGWPLLGKYSEVEIEDEFNSIINILIDNKGHWDKNIFNANKKFRFNKIKHIKNISISALGNRLYEKILKYYI